MKSGPAWGSKLFLMLATTTVVIANRHHYYNNKSFSYENVVTKQRHSKIPHLRHQHVSHKGPYFENDEGQEINESQNLVHLGDDALLDCRVVMLAGKTVLWLRQSPERTILTVGDETYIENPRYGIRFKYPNNWRLRISSVQKEDRGSYLCTINTHPPKMLVTHITILAPDIRIVDDSGHQLHDRYYKTGSVITLWCKVRASHLGARIPYPEWKKNDAALPEHVNVHHINGTNNEIVSKLHIKQARKLDSGEYLCSSSVVNIHVLNGEKQAAVHLDQWNAASTIHRFGTILAGLTTLLLRTTY